MKTRHWIILILVLASILRFYGLSRGDTVNDEVFYGFRAIGLMDFDEAADQTTPWEWFDPQIPFWTKLSFHDHPPLVFWIQHFSILIFGENNFALRLPSAVLGIISVYLLYLIGRRLYSKGTGLFSAALLASTLNSVYIARTGMQEPYVIFFLLLSIYLFLRSLEKENYLIWTGVALGFGFLAKYNLFVLVPAFLTYLAFFRRDYLLNKKLWLGALLSIVIFSPVVIYNLQLYRAVGHFDFQFSHIFRQNPEIWQVQPGKEIGTLGERVKNFIPRLIGTNSWLFLVTFALSFLAFIKSFVSDRKTSAQKHGMLLIIFAYLILLLLFIGPSFRFLTMLTPFAALVAGVFVNYFYSCFLKGKLRKGLVLAFALFLSFEIFYSYNNQIAYYPIGKQPWISSKVRFENYNWGYNALGEFFTSELEGKVPAIRFNARYKFIESQQDKYIKMAKRKKLEPYPAMIVTHGNFDRGAKLWILDRLQIYRGWPVITLETYFDYLEENGSDYYDAVGFRHYYFVSSEKIFPAPEFNFLTAGTKPIIIKNPREDGAFKIYHVIKSAIQDKVL